MKYMWCPSNYSCTVASMGSWELLGRALVNDAAAWHLSKCADCLLGCLPIVNIHNWVRQLCPKCCQRKAGAEPVCACVWVLASVCMHVYMCVNRFLCVAVCVYMCACVLVYACAQSHLWSYIHLCAYQYVHMCTYQYVRVCICLYVHVCAYVYMYICLVSAHLS